MGCELGLFYMVRVIILIVQPIRNPNLGIISVVAHVLGRTTILGIKDDWLTY